MKSFGFWPKMPAVLDALVTGVYRAELELPSRPSFFETCHPKFACHLLAMRFFISIAMPL